MSYLNPVRLVFKGQFQADPSTVNNDPTHYDTANFKTSYQDYQTATDPNGWWNPDGSGAFRLLDSAVVGVHYADGTSTDNAALDPVVGSLVLNAATRTSGKIVDLDPQFQLASQIWGMQVRLALLGRDEAQTYLDGRYLENPFRDLWFTRIAGKRGDEAASASFQSVLIDISWAEKLPDSRFLSQLRAATQGGLLSIRLVTYAYQGSRSEGGFTFGTLIGAIGPYLRGEPKSFVAGRRFAPQFGGTSWNNINFCTGSVVSPSNGPQRLLIDLGNALPLNCQARPVDLGAVSVAFLANTAAPEGSPASGGSITRVGEVPYLTPDWLTRTSGIVEFTLSLSPQQVAQTPLALIAQPVGTGLPVIALRETANGLFTGAEPFVIQMDSDVAAPVQQAVTFYATQFGLPLPEAEIVLAATTAALDPGGPGLTPGVPATAVTFAASVTTGDDGTVQTTIAAIPPGNPRTFIDGQLYEVAYNVAGEPRSDYGPFEYITIHVRDAHTVPANPTWAIDVEPILKQYADLYPIMSKGLFELADPHSMLRFRKLLLLSFSLDLADPNSMPATRDLSAGKRQTIVTWLQRLDTWAELEAQGKGQESSFDPAFRALLQAPTLIALRAAATSSPTSRPDAEALADSKTQAAQRVRIGRRGT